MGGAIGKEGEGDGDTSATALFLIEENTFINFVGEEDEGDVWGRRKEVAW